jgi:predicted small lipoprotein YifL
MNKRISQIAMLALLTGMISCGKKVPKDIIQPDAMENLLYDYHGIYGC